MSGSCGSYLRRNRGVTSARPRTSSLPFRCTPWRAATNAVLTPRIARYCRSCESWHCAMRGLSKHWVISQLRVMVVHGVARSPALRLLKSWCRCWPSERSHRPVRLFAVWVLRRWLMPDGRIHFGEHYLRARAINAEPWEPPPGMVKRQCSECRYFFAAAVVERKFKAVLCPDCATTDLCFGVVTSMQPELPPASRTSFVGSPADHPLNLCHQLIQIERLGHDFHAVLHAAVANGCVLGIAG